MNPNKINLFIVEKKAMGQKTAIRFMKGIMLLYQIASLKKPSAKKVFNYYEKHLKHYTAKLSPQPQLLLALGLSK